MPLVGLVCIGLAQSIAITGGDGNWRSLSINVESSRRAVTVLIFLVIAFVIAANFFASRRRLSAIATFLTLFGLALAVFALVQHFTWNGRFYWLRPNSISTSPFGPFVNHNHFAGYMEMLIPIPLALMITRAVRGEMRLLYGFAATMMGVAAVASLSRGGMISIAASLVFIFVMSLRLARIEKRGGTSAQRRALPAAVASSRPALLPRAVVVILIAGVIAAGVFWIGPDSVINRVTQGEVQGRTSQRETFYASRGWLWSDTLAMIKANPALGVGLGAYETAFSLYTRSDGALRVPQAHNDYLQVVADCGILGGALAVWFIVILFRNVRRGIKSRDTLVAGLALGSGTSIFAMLVHSLFDFNLQLPSNALLFLFLSAIASQVCAIALDTERSSTLPARRGHSETESENVSVASLVKGAS
jgi:O-antigen ligase